jgi:hypothetical protein
VLTNSTIAYNTCGGLGCNGTDATISNTILAENNGQDYFVQNAISLTDNGFNIVGNQISSDPEPTDWKFTHAQNILYNFKADGTANTVWSRNNVDLTNQDLNLSNTLADNNTSNGTQTLAVESGSFAIGAGNADPEITTDQRGVTRGDPPTIGAYEFPAGVTITWDGSVNSDWDNADNWGGSVPGFSDDVVIANETHSPVISPTSFASCKNLTINNGAKLVIQSNSSRTGSLITKGAITNNGTIEVQQYISDSQWHLFAAPNNSTVAGSFVDEFLQNWSENTALWTDITNAAEALIPVKGYGLYTNPSKSEVYTFTGKPNTGNQTLAVSYTSNGSEYAGANLLGNPYPSCIDWSGLDDTWGAVYYWNGTAYDSWNNGIGTGSQYVPAMQGFFIVTSAAGTFELSDDDRAHNDQPYYKSLKSNSIVLETISKDYSDKLTINLDLSSTQDFDLQRDAYKLQSGTEGLSELYSFAGDKKTSIDVRPECDVLQLGFYNSQAGIYNIGISEIADITEAVLEDTKTETFHNLIDGAYEFVWTTSDNEKRFKLHMNSVGIEESIENQSNALIYISGKEIIIKGSEKGNVTVSDIMGRIVLEKTISDNKVTSITTKFKSGVYMVTLVSGNSIVSEKVFIK